MQEWSERLGSLTGEQIARGLDRISGKWPPNVEQFKAACLGDMDDWEHRGQAYKSFRKALPKPTADPELVREEIAKMRGALKCGPTDDATA